MKKQFIIILIILCILVSIIGLYIHNQNRMAEIAKQNNLQYQNYYEKEILGTTLISLINKSIDSNEKNEVPKKENTIYYEDNEKNSINISVKFLETDKLIKMEDIAAKKSESFIQYFATATFKCTRIEYHERTNFVKSLYFEQISL